jgi:hypothetical protein
MPDRRKFSENLKRGGGPGRGRGRVQIAAKRAALLAGERLISTADVLAIAYARRKLLHGLPVRRHHYRLATSALELIAVRVRRLIVAVAANQIHGPQSMSGGPHGR